MHPRMLAFVLLLLGAAASLTWADAAPRQVGASSGLLNAGFEDGVLGGLPAAWSVDQPIPDAVVVVGQEDGLLFPTYTDMGNVVVQPYRGDRMLRLGTPKRTSENQNRGANAVRQTFVSEQDTLSFAFRLFSWEMRDRDSFGFDLRNGSSSVGTMAAPLTLTMPDGSTRSCAALPCNFGIDVGRSGDYLDTGWRTVDITGLPVGASLTVEFSAGGTNDESHGTWAYFDNTEIKNDPPVAVFGFSPSPTYEGDTVVFEDRSYEPDAGDQIVSWHWVIDGEAFDSRNPAFVFPDEGTYNATLTVTSSDGRSTTVSSGETASDGTPVPPIVVQNVDPLVNALNAEALAGQPVPLIARFADPGWMDTHTADWSVGGQSPAAALEEDDLPAYETGIVMGVVTAGSTASGNVVVHDNDGGAGSDDFSITVVPDDQNRYEPNNTLTGAPVLEADGSYLSYIQSPGDVDLFEIRMPGGGALLAGSEVLLTLRDLPADYDLAVVAVSPSPAGDPGESGQTSFNTTPFARSPFARSPFARSPFARSPFARSPFARSGFTFPQIPLSEVGFIGLEGDEVSGTDIGLGELGLGGIDATNLRVAGFSASRGLNNETVLVRTNVAGTRIYAAVIGANQEFEAAPFRLQAEASSPLNLASLLGPEQCTGTPVVSTGVTSLPVALYDNPGPARTVFVTQRERMRTLFSMDDAAWNAMLADLTALAQHPAVQGDILSLPSAIFDNWDEQPCSIDAANALTAQIRSIIAPMIGGADYVVLVGDDGVVPFRRVPDETTFSNERDYAFDAYLRPGSPLFASVVLGYNLTDDYYVDAAPTAWQGRELYVPDIPIARLVETPDEIRAAAQAFVSSNGVLNPASGFVSGYDFFADGGQEMADSLAAKLPTTTLINDTWTADELRCRGFGIPVSGLSGCAAPSIGGVNAHFAHYGALSANGFDTLSLDDFMTSTDLAGAAIQGSLIFSMGCHAGFNAPDRDSEAADPGLGIDPALDFAQAMAIQQALFVASTGFGLGDTVGLGGTEKLLANFAGELMPGDVAAGAALVSAKRSYVNSLSAMTVYDEKSTIQTTMYGLPMYRIVTGAGALAPGQVQAATSSLALPVPSLSLTTIDGAITTAQVIPYAEHVTPDGTYFDAGGDVQSTGARPVQPRVVVEPPPGVPVHSAMLLGGAYTEIAGFDPVIASPNTELIVNPEEPQVCLRSFWPSTLSTINSLTGPDGLEQAVVFLPAEFLCTSPAGSPVTGLERVYSALTFELLRCESADFVPPIIHRVELVMDNGTVHATVDASDASGIVKLVALRLSADLIVPTILNVAPGDTGPFEMTIPDMGAEDRLVIQVLDGACNMSTATGKGAKLKAMLIDAGADKAFVPGDPVNFPVKVFNLAGLTTPLYYEWDFGDGTLVSETLAPLDLVPDGLGNATFTVRHAYATAALTGTAHVTVFDADGAIAIDAVTFACDETNDVDADALSVCTEAAIGTDAGNLDTDGDGCSDGEEVLNLSPMMGGLRNPLDYWDFFDVTGDRVIDLSDAVSILSHFGMAPGPGNIWDRRINVQATPWRTSPGDDGVDLTDVLNNLESYGHSCLTPP